MGRRWECEGERGWEGDGSECEGKRVGRRWE